MDAQTPPTPEASDTFTNAFNKTAHPSIFDSASADRASLYRKEYIDASDATKYGTPIATLPVSWQLISAFLILIFFCSLAILVTNKFERRETVRGILRSVDGEAQVTPPDRGTIRQINTKEGAHVTQGQTLLVIANDRLDFRYGEPQDEMLKALDQQENDLRKRLTAVGTANALQIDANNAQASQLRSQLSVARSDLEAGYAQLKIAKEELDIAAPIVRRGFISKNELHRRQQNFIIANQNVKTSAGKVTQLKSQIDEQAAAARRQPYSATAERGVIEDALADIKQRRAQFNSSAGFKIRAPFDGHIAAMQADVGMTVDPNRPILTIVPNRASVKAIFYVASRGAGFLKIGQLVRIRYDAYPFQAFGTANARIATVSSAIFRPEDIDSAMRPTEPAYKVTATLEKQEISAFGEKHELLPGMAFSADVVLEKRSLAAWLLEPLISLKGRL